ncbi:MAG: hypothetical protein M3Y17_03975 [Actinomycetota bacterium]|nr:hypothetical protein [Actinomycetota bacterium]
MVAEPAAAVVERDCLIEAPGVVQYGSWAGMEARHPVGEVRDLLGVAVGNVAGGREGGELLWSFLSGSFMGVLDVAGPVFAVRLCPNGLLHHAYPGCM